MNNTGLKFGGRVKGTPNRNSKEMRLILENVVNLEVDNLSYLLEQLEPKERVTAIIKLLQFTLPKATEIAEVKEIKEFTVKVINSREEYLESLKEDSQL